MNQVRLSGPWLWQSPERVPCSAVEQRAQAAVSSVLIALLGSSSSCHQVRLLNRGSLKTGRSVECLLLLQMRVQPGEGKVGSAGSCIWQINGGVLTGDLGCPSPFFFPLQNVTALKHQMTFPPALRLFISEFSTFQVFVDHIFFPLLF